MFNFFRYILIVAVVLTPTFVFAASANGTIDPSHSYTWGDNLAWINFNATNSNVVVSDSALTGNIWSQTYGWISLNPNSTTYVTNDGQGNLSGYAWGQNVGWINFQGAIINSSGKFTGVIGTDSNSAGRISFDCTNCDVETDWRPQPVKSSSGGGAPLITYVPPTTTTVPNPAVTPTTLPPVVNPTTPPPTNISGCDTRTTGFSITTGQSCLGNTSGITTTIPSTLQPQTINPTTSSGPSTYNFGTVTLRKGSKGAAVKELQRYLNDNMHLGLMLDGIFGSKTTLIVQKWQLAHKLLADGLVGVKTKAMMLYLVQQ